MQLLGNTGGIYQNDCPCGRGQTEFHKGCANVPSLCHFGFVQVFEYIIQHYDENMLKIYFKILDLINPDINLEVVLISYIEPPVNVILRINMLIKSDYYRLKP